MTIYFKHYANATLIPTVEILLNTYPTVRAILIAAIDSDPRPAETELGATLSAGEGVNTCGPFLVANVKVFRWLVKDPRVFAGFDEVWGLEEMPHATEGLAPRIGADRVLNCPARATDLAWLEAHRGRFGVGDGDGVNVVAPLSALERVSRHFEAP